MTDETGFKIRNKTYPWSGRVKATSAVLVEKVTGLTWMEFLDRMDKQEVVEGGTVDPVISIGLVAMAIKQANESWTRDDVLTFMDSLDLEEIEWVGPSDVESADPLAPAGPTPPVQPVSPSSSDSESQSDPSTQNPFGHLASVTTSQA